MAPERDAYRIDFEIVMDLFRDFANQFVHIKLRQHGVGDGDQDTEVITLAAQQVVIDIVGGAVLDLFCHHGHNLGKGVQAFILRLTPRLVSVTNKLATAKNMPFYCQRQHAVVPERLI